MEGLELFFQTIEVFMKWEEKACTIIANSCNKEF